MSDRAILSVKYTAGIPFMIGLIFVLVSRGRKGGWRPAVASGLIFGGAALIPWTPWLIKNLLYVGNPIFPLSIFRINGLGTVWVNAEVRENEANQVRVGNLVEARTPALPDKVFKGRVLSDGKPLKRFRIDDHDVESADGRFELTVTDDGRGIDTHDLFLSERDQHLSVVLSLVLKLVQLRLQLADNFRCQSITEVHISETVPQVAKKVSDRLRRFRVEHPLEDHPMHAAIFDEPIDFDQVSCREWWFPKTIPNAIW